MKRKREQINNSNINEFCGNVDEGCARVNTLLKRSKNTKSHLRSMYEIVNNYMNTVYIYRVLTIVTERRKYYNVKI